MSIYNEYLVGAERDFAIEEATFNAEFSKLTTMLEMVNLQLEQMQKDAELKVLTESGTYDDLTYLYQEAENDVAGQKKNIISRFFDMISKLFSAISNKFQKLLSGSNNSQDELIDAPIDVIEDTNALQTAMFNANNGIAKLRNGDLSGALDILKAIKIPVIAAVGSAVAAKVALKKFKKSELLEKSTKLNETFEKLNKTFTSAKDAILNLFKKFMPNKFKKPGSANQNETPQTNPEEKPSAAAAENQNNSGELKKESVDNNNDMNLLSEAMTIIEKIGAAVNALVAKISSFIFGSSKNDDDSTDGQSNGEPAETKEEEKNTKPFEKPQKFGNVRWRIMTDGSVMWANTIDENWHEPDASHRAPNAIVNRVNNLKKQGKLAQESYSLSLLRSEFGDAYIIESCAGGFIFSDNNEFHMESASRSIFGDVEADYDMYAESSSFDSELEKLSTIFESL